MKQIKLIYNLLAIKPTQTKKIPDAFIYLLISKSLEHT